MSKRIVILGAGESGTGAALLAHAKGYEVFVSDFGVISEKYKSQLEKLAIRYEEGCHTEALILNADEVIKSPGIPEKAPVIQKLREARIPVIDELEFAARYTDAKIIAITGTNGKTTTTLLTYHLLKEAGFKVGLAGNIGYSMAKQVIKDEFDYYVLEVSSFQLDGTYKFEPHISMLLNITPDHLDRYEDLMQNYVDSKFRIIQSMTKRDHFVYFNEDGIIGKELSKRKVSPKQYAVSLAEDSNADIRLDEGRMSFQIQGVKFLISPEDTTLRGKHNLINTMSAVTAATLAGVGEEDIRRALKTFSNAPHRLEYIATINGVDFVNDSKATNIDAVRYALDSFSQPLVWIAGGVDKGNDYSLIMEMVNEKVKALVCLGKDNEKLREAFHEDIMDLLETDDIKEAVKSAMEYAEAHDVVLLSPACASFDLFKNYEDRGDQFREAVLDLKKRLEDKSLAQ
ncbi:MAG: UDP-N-acetylmuramoyl-L-alanine--D-glutamate ligase [Bacteroidota bacterium]